MEKIKEQLANIQAQKAQVENAIKQTQQSLQDLISTFQQLIGAEKATQALLPQLECSNREQEETKIEEEMS